MDNYGKFTYTATSDLPRVRIDIRQYLTTSRATLPVFQLTKVGKLGDNQYFSIYGGALESMFAGVGGEWLYRPADSELAIGIDMNGVRQRGFRQDLALLPYRTVTGHLTAYWKTGWNGVQVNVSVGAGQPVLRPAKPDLALRRGGDPVGQDPTAASIMVVFRMTRTPVLSRSSENVDDGDQRQDEHEQDDQRRRPAAKQHRHRALEVRNRYHVHIERIAMERNQRLIVPDGR